MTKGKPISETRRRFLDAIARLGETEIERAKRAGFTVRTIDNWERGIGLSTVERLVEAGILKIVEPSDCGTDIAAN